MARGPEFRAALKAGRRMLGGWVNMNSPIATEIMGRAGFDAIMIDQEHGPGDAMAAIQQQQAIRSGGNSACFLRVHDNDPQLIKRALDSGIDGLMVPLVETAEAAASIVASCRMPPLGLRGVAPGNVRAADYGFSKDAFIETRGTDVFVMSQVESATTVANLKEIGKVDGIDMLFIGRNDLASSIGKLADLNDPEAKELREEAERLIKESGRFLGGIPGPADSAKDMFARGYDFVIAVADHALLRDGAVACVKPTLNAEAATMARFAPILARALKRTGGEAKLEAQLPKPTSAKALAALNDDRYLSQMSLRVFRAGLKHSLVDSKWPAFEEAFHGFVPGPRHPDERRGDRGLHGQHGADPPLGEDPLGARQRRGHAADRRGGRQLRRAGSPTGRRTTSSACGMRSPSASASSAATPAPTSCAWSARTPSC